MDVAEIKQRLADRAEEVCHRLLPGGKKHGHEYMVGSLNGEPGDSLRVCLSGRKAGVWKDFAGDTGGSNLLELWIQKTGLPYQDALKEVKSYLGIRDEDDEKFHKRKARSYKKPDKKNVAAATSKVTDYLTKERKLSRTTITEFKLAADKKDEAICFPYIDQKGELELLKFIKLERNERGKKDCWTSADSRKGLFGKHLVRPTDRSITITEGEIDAMSWHQIGIRGLSVPFGAKSEGKDGSDPNDEWIENDWEMLESMERIYLCFDNDDEGRKARDSVIKRLGRERCYVVDLGKFKDANEALQAGDTAAMMDAHEAAKTLDPEQLRNASDFKKDVYDLIFENGAPVTPGIPMPFATPTGSFHWRWNEVTIFTGLNGSGKTVLLNWLMIMFGEMEKRTMIASLEVPVKQTIRYMLSQVLGVDLPRDREQLDLGVDYLAENFWFFDHVGQIKQRDLFDSMRYAYRRYGVQFFVIDSLLKCGIEEDDYPAQKKFVDKLTDFVRDHSAHVILVAHSKKKESERDAPGKMDIKGSGSITDLAHNVFSVWRNKPKEKIIKQCLEDGSEPMIHKMNATMRSKPDAKWECHKQRNGTGDEPEWLLWYHKHARQFDTAFIDMPKILAKAGEQTTEPSSDDPGMYSTDLSGSGTEPQEPEDDDIPF